MIRQIISLSGFILASAAALVPFAAAQAHQPTGSVVHFFRGPDGDYPNPTLTQDSAGNLYATSRYGGNTTAAACRDIYPEVVGCGTVVRLNAPNWSIDVLAAFSDPHGPVQPNGGVYVDKTGAVYGTSSKGGAYGYGTFFKLTPPTAGHTVWNQTVLLSFSSCSLPGNLVADATGSLYTVGYNIGCKSNVNWEILKLTPTTSGSWTSTVITSVDYAGDDPAPIGDLAIDSSGALYVATSDSGYSYSDCKVAGGCGMVWQIAPPAKSTSGWTRTPIYTFNFSEGTPASGIVVGKAGTLYGTTAGVTDCTSGCGGGVMRGWQYKKSGNTINSQPASSSDSGPGVYKLTPPSPGMGAWSRTIVSYINGGGFNSIIAYKSGALFISQDGVATFPGDTEDRNGASLFKLTPSSGQSLWGATNLYTFTSHEADGVFGMLIGRNGMVYETANSTAKTSQGTIVEVTP